MKIFSQNNMNSETTFKTPNIFLAAFLLTSEVVDLLDIDRSNPKSYEFIFTPRFKCLELMDQYHRGYEFPAKRLFTEYTELRRLIRTKGGRA